MAGCTLCFRQALPGTFFTGFYATAVTAAAWAIGIQPGTRHAFPHCIVVETFLCSTFTFIDTFAVTASIGTYAF